MAKITKTIFLTAAEAATYKSTGTCQHLLADGETYITVSDTDTDCIVYCPEDELHHYSTTEQVVGTWIDGKPLYEKTITITKSTQRDSSYNFADVGIPTVIDTLMFEWTFKDNSGNVGKDWCVDSSHLIRFLPNIINNTLLIACGSTEPATPIIITAILRYTKTTD